MDPNLVQPVPPTNATVSLSEIKLEVLKEDNYGRWSILMQHYLVAQGLWDVVLSSEIPWPEDTGDWIKRNASALFAIKISCGTETFHQIQSMNSAKDAWNALADLHKPPNVDSGRGSETDAVKETLSGILGNFQRADEFVTLLKDIYEGNWNALKSFDRITEIIFLGGFTALHIATIASHLKIVNALVNIAREDYLEIQDDNGDTALSLAACNGEKKIAECLVQKNDKLLTIRNKEGYIPLVVACFNKKKDMSSYLYSMTPFEFLLPENSNQGTLFLKYCVLNSMLDAGWDLLLRCPQLAASIKESISISELSAHPSIFPSKRWLFPYEEFLYTCLCILKLPSPSKGTGSRHKIFGTQEAWVKVIDGILELLLFIPRRFFGAARLMDIYELKLTHMCANSVLQYWCKEILTYRDARQLVESGTISAMFQAIKNGPVEIVIGILKANPDLIWCNKKLLREILISAIKYRQAGILGFVHKLDAGKKAFLSLGDEDSNVLHLIAKLPDLSHYNNLYPAWIMQHEVKWFEEVRSVLPRGYQGAKNLYGEIPAQVFYREHQQLIKEASEWIKKTADSYILVPVLIVTIMFAALFTVPGGNNQDTGIPILLHRKLFAGFLICDVVSFLTASTSMLEFLYILTTSHGAFYFRRVMPLNLMVAISSLIISIATMILAFIFALTMTLQKRWEVLPAIIIYLLTFLFSFLFGWVYLTLAGIYKWTFRSIIFQEMVNVDAIY